MATFRLTKNREEEEDDLLVAMRLSTQTAIREEQARKAEEEFKLALKLSKDADEAHQAHQAQMQLQQIRNLEEYVQKLQSTIDDLRLQIATEKGNASAEVEGIVLKLARQMQAQAEEIGALRERNAQLQAHVAHLQQMQTKNPSNP